MELLEDYLFQRIVEFAEQGFWQVVLVSRRFQRVAYALHDGPPADDLSRFGFPSQDEFWCDGALPAWRQVKHLLGEFDRRLASRDVEFLLRQCGRNPDFVRYAMGQFHRHFGAAFLHDWPRRKDGFAKLIAKNDIELFTLLLENLPIRSLLTHDIGNLAPENFGGESCEPWAFFRQVVLHNWKRRDVPNRECAACEPHIYARHPSCILSAIVRHDDLELLRLFPWGLRWTFWRRAISQLDGEEVPPDPLFYSIWLEQKQIAAYWQEIGLVDELTLGFRTELVQRSSSCDQLSFALRHGVNLNEPSLLLIALSRDVDLALHLMNAYPHWNLGQGDSQAIASALGSWTRQDQERIACSGIRALLD